MEIIILFLFILIFYSKTLSFQYVSDDIPSAARKETHPKWKYALLVLEGHLKSKPWIDHLITTILHAFVCVFIYLGFGANLSSLLAAILFSVNPINNQGAVWISGRGYVLSALGMTIALSFPKLSVPALILATYSNAGFLSPLCFIGSQYPWFLLFMPIVWAIHISRFKKNVVAKMNTEMYVEDRAIHPKKLILGVKTFAFYFIHCLSPHRHTFYHAYMQSMAGSGKEKSYSLKDKYFWWGILILASIGFYWVYVPWNMASFGLLWFCICLAPFCNIMRMQQEIAERYAYLPNVGLMVSVGYFLANYPIIYAMLFGAYMMKMWLVTEMYKDDAYLVEASCIYEPRAWFCWHIKAMRRWDSQSHQEAVIYWLIAKQIHPNEFKILINLASAFKLSNHHKEAQDLIEQAEKTFPKGQETQCAKICEDWKKGQYSIIL